MTIFVKKPYTGQRLIVRHKTGIDLTDFDSIIMKGYNPVTGGITQKTATRVNSSDVVSAIFLPTDLTDAGLWRFQTIVTFGVDSVYPCKTQYQMIYELGN